MWIGQPYRIDLTPLGGSEAGGEFNELQLGYNYNANSPYAPSNWLK